MPLLYTHKTKETNLTHKPFPTTVLILQSNSIILQGHIDLRIAKRSAIFPAHHFQTEKYFLHCNHGPLCFQHQFLGYHFELQHTQVLTWQVREHMMYAAAGRYSLYLQSTIGGTWPIHKKIRCEESLKSSQLCYQKKLC